MKRCIDDELNSFLQGKGLVNMGATGEVKSLHALKLGGQEGVNRLENHVPGNFGGLRQRMPNMICVQVKGSRPVRGVIIHVLDTKRIINLSTALNNVPDPCTFAPSLLRILNIHAHFFCAFSRFTTTKVHSSYKSMRTHPR